ncbi:MAG: membrane protein [Candidatus Cloacimonas sp. 4484_140]|nr:MAG: membrane protein [Candidatus Cloacimonas sp. 4484_140]
MNFENKCTIDRRTNAIIGLVVFLSVFIIYYITKPVSLSFWDCGEYISCSSILGVPHPPGNPFYILLGKFFTLLPFGLSHAQKVSLLSIFFSCFASLFVYLSIVKLVAIWETKQIYAYIAGVFGALFIAFSQEFWLNAIEAEVYGGLSFFIALIIWLTLIWTEKQKNFNHQNILLLIVYLFFLGFSVHQTTLQIAPAVLLIVVLPLLKFDKNFYKKLAIFVVIGLALYYIFYLVGTGFGQGSLGKYIFALFVISVLIYYLRDYVQPQVWFFALLMVILGLSTHLILPIRAAADPFINEGDPSTLQRFMDYVFRKQYGPTSFTIRRAPIFMQLDFHFLRYFSWQFFDAQVISNFLNVSRQFIHTIFQFIVVALGLTGFYYQFKKSKRSFIYLASFFIMASIAMILVMNLSSAEVRDRPYFFITAYMLWAFWMGIGAMGIVRYLRKRSKILSIIALCLLATLPIINMASHYHKNDRSQELLSLEYGTNFLNGLDKNAIIFTNGDNDTFPLWYSQAVYDPNAEEYFLEEDTLLFEEIKGFSISDKEDIPRKTQTKLNEAYMAKKDLGGIRKDVSVANLSLLNTPWYIKQLRDFEGIEINLSDKQIDALHPIQLANEANFRVGDIKLTFPKDKQLFVKDQMVLQIIKDNYGKRPIYFAVTVADRVSFDEYLQSEGMADRLVSTKAKYQINAPRLNHNIENVFEYNSIYNEDLYKDENMKRLINNYGADFMRMSTTFYQNGDYENAVKYLKKAMDFVKEKDRYLPSLANLYYEMGLYDSALSVIEPLLQKNPEDAQLIYLEVEFLVKNEDIATALNTLEDFIIKHTDQHYFLNRYINIVRSNPDYAERAVDYMDELIKQNPKNKSFQQFKAQLEGINKK